MTISSVSSGGMAAQLLQAQSETSETHKAGRDARNDGDSDDKAVSAAVTPRPTVNTQGQTIGSIVNTTA